MNQLEVIKIDDVEYVRKDIIQPTITVEPIPPGSHPMLGKECIVRTYSAGVHFGTIDYINEMECHLVNAYRLWKWENGGLSLSAVNQNGMKGGRINFTGKIYLTNCIEHIEMTEVFKKSYEKFIED